MISINGIRNTKVEAIMEIIGDDTDMLAAVISQFMIDNELSRYAVVTITRDPNTDELIASTGITIEKHLLNTEQEG